MKRITVIANPFAGTARGRLGDQKARQMLVDAGFETKVLLTQAPGHAVELAVQASSESDLVVALGGDGTVHEVARGLLGTRCPMAVLPSGSGNDFAQGIGCGTVTAAFDAIINGVDRPLDMASLDDSLFLNSVGLAASGLISGKAAKLWRFLGRARYILASVSVLVTYRGQEISWNFEVDSTTGNGSDNGPLNQQTGQFMLVEICNGPSTGGGFRLSPDADPGDQMLDICLVRPVTATTGLKLLPAAASGKKLEHEAISRIRSDKMEFTTSEPIAWHCDGEPGILPAGRHCVQVLSEKLLVRLPAT